MSLAGALALLEAEKQKLDRAIASLSDLNGAGQVAPLPAPKRNGKPIPRTNKAGSGSPPATSITGAKGTARRDRPHEMRTLRGGTMTSSTNGQGQYFPDFPIAALRESPWNPRQHYAAQGLEELAATAVQTSAPRQKQKTRVKPQAGDVRRAKAKAKAKTKRQAVGG